MESKETKLEAIRMQNRLPFILLACIALATSARSQPNEEAMSRDQILKMIPTSHGNLDLYERENLLKLIAAGDAIYPVLCEELGSTNDPHRSAMIISILGEAKVNKDPALACIREYMERHKSDDPQLDSIFTGLRALGNIGNSSDLKLLSEFLEIGGKVDRVVAKQAIAQIRTREQAEKRASERQRRRTQTEATAKTQVVDSPPGNPLSPAPSKTEATRFESIYFRPWVIGVVILVAVAIVLSTRKHRRSR
jgi:hypothetical protein